MFLDGRICNKNKYIVFYVNDWIDDDNNVLLFIL